MQAICSENKRTSDSDVVSHADVLDGLLTAAREAVDDHWGQHRLVLVENFVHLVERVALVEQQRLLQLASQLHLWTEASCSVSKQQMLIANVRTTRISTADGCSRGEAYLLLEDVHLHLLVGEVTVEVESNLSDGDALRVLRNFLQFAQRLALPSLSVVRVHACKSSRHFRHHVSTGCIQFTDTSGRCTTLKVAELFEH